MLSIQGQHDSPIGTLIGIGLEDRLCIMRIVVLAAWNAMRPKHWIKNLLVLALPLSDGLLLGKYFREDALLRSILMFVSLSLISSANYMLNDLMDINEDRKHPTKKFRPLALGTITPRTSVLLSLSLVLLGTFFAFWVGQLTVVLAVLLFGMSQASYTFVLKNLMGYDIIALALLYVYRAVIPATYENIALSKWFLVMSFSTALFLASGKRYAEFKHVSGSTTRRVLQSYTEIQLFLWVGVSLSLLLISYLNWIFASRVDGGLAFLLASVVPVFLILIKVSFLVLSEAGEDPTKILFRSKDIPLLCTVWLFFYLAGKDFL